MPESKDRTYWLDKAQTLPIEGRAFIDGAYVDAQNRATFTSFSPIDGAPLASVAQCASADVDLAVAAARRSFEAGVWSDLSARERKTLLLNWAQLLEAHTQELALLESLDSGKPIADTLGGDLPGTLYCLRWFAELIDKVHGEVPTTDPHFFGTVTQQPMGVVAAVVPWNYPLLMAAWKFAPALAAGNSVVLKPSEKTPLSALRIAALALQAGIPAGVFNVLSGADAQHLMEALEERFVLELADYDAYRYFQPAGNDPHLKRNTVALNAQIYAGRGPQTNPVHDLLPVKIGRASCRERV